MSSVRKHTCVDESPGPATTAVKRGVTRPRRVLSSDDKIKTGVKATTGKIASAPHVPKYPAKSASHRPGARRNVTKKPSPESHSHTLSRGDTGDFTGSRKVSPDNKNTLKSPDVSVRSVKSNEIPDSPVKSAVHEIYKNNNFKTQPELMPTNICERVLDPITENSETRTCCSSKSSSAENCALLRATRRKMVQDKFDVSGPEMVNDVSTFRKKHFFECHSAETMLKQKASALRDPNHVCTYKFYLNERLFPTPLYSDIHNNIRCSDCFLPMSSPSTNTKCSDQMNATIQAKVTMGSDDQLKDVIITLPANNNLLVMEKNKNVKELLSEDVIHFGILKIDNRRPALVASQIPDNSFALRYQKGYREYVENDNITVSGVSESQIVYV